METLVLNIPAKYLAGLDRIVLRDYGSLTRHERKRRERIPGQAVCGSYYRATRTSRPWIDLFVDEILDGEPRVLLAIPLTREIIFSEAVFHEIGHHIHAGIEPRHEDSEAAANRWRKRLTGEFLKRRYWYLMPLLKLLSKSRDYWRK